jgi:hypothetical protein
MIMVMTCWPSNDCVVLGAGLCLTIEGSLITLAHKHATHHFAA